MAVVFKIHFVETGGFGAKILAFDRARLGNVDVAIADPMALECLVRRLVAIEGCFARSRTIFLSSIHVVSSCLSPIL